MRNAQSMAVSAVTPGTIDPGRTSGALWAKGLSGGDSFSATLGPGETFAHLFALEGNYHYHLETSPYSAGLVTVLSKEDYCSSQDAITADSLEAARAALEAGATAVSLSPAGCVTYSRTMSAPWSHTRANDQRWTMETWDHTATESLGLRTQIWTGSSSGASDRGSWALGHRRVYNNEHLFSGDHVSGPPRDL